MDNAYVIHISFDQNNNILMSVFIRNLVFNCHH